MRQTLFMGQEAGEVKTGPQRKTLIAVPPHPRPRALSRANPPERFETRRACRAEATAAGNGAIYVQSAIVYAETIRMDSDSTATGGQFCMLLNRLYARLKRFFIPYASGAPAFDEVSRLRTRAMLLCLAAVCLLSLAALINLYGRMYGLVAPLFLEAAVAFAGLVWLQRGGTGRIPILATSLGLIILSAYMLGTYEFVDSGHLVWYLLFPPIVMFCAGLKWGTFLFVLFYVQLLVSFLSPASAKLAPHMPPMLTMRFMTAMFACMIFAWMGEFLRDRTERALAAALRKLEHEALADPLTGIGNRRSFHLHAAWVTAQARRKHLPYALALIDIDKFKHINDVHGHQIGDKVLHHSAAVLSANRRMMDRLFRLGGDEFLLLMAETTGEEARIVAERLRRSIENTPCIDRAAHIAYTVSIGLYSGRPDESLEEHLAAADRNLYAAKKTGRNHVYG